MVTTNQRQIERLNENEKNFDELNRNILKKINQIEKS